MCGTVTHVAKFIAHGFHSILHTHPATKPSSNQATATSTPLTGNSAYTQRNTHTHYTSKHVPERQQPIRRSGVCVNACVCSRIPLRICACLILIDTINKLRVHSGHNENMQRKAFSALALAKRGEYFRAQFTSVYAAREFVVYSHACTTYTNIHTYIYIYRHVKWRLIKLYAFGNVWRVL